jgi:hypothetical protein
MYLRRQGEGYVASSCRSQSGGLGKDAGRSIKRTMQPRNGLPRLALLAETGFVDGDALEIRGSLESPCEHNGMVRRTTGVGSTACIASTAVKVGKVPWVAEALPHSEGAAYKRLCREVAACLRD